MNKMYNGKLTPVSKVLRKNMTKEEKHLWYDFLKDLPVNVNRQKVFDRYIVDFYIPSAKIVIELDGEQHYIDDGLIKDAQRDEFFSKNGIRVLRYSNRQINQQFKNVCDDIYSNIFG
ncbi:MAG: endonuclease domain-containing protein [Ruminococcaceae bacterium]|nr:endonuclease domain-containing protein [Oscillospiraceae bacterium]